MLAQSLPNTFTLGKKGHKSHIHYVCNQITHSSPKQEVERGNSAWKKGNLEEKKKHIQHCFSFDHLKIAFDKSKRSTVTTNT